ncbi:MAG: hypothetical protein Q9160_000205 [Pyrenula sp. 1 TL-2023]
MGSRHFSSGGYDAIATALFTTLAVHTFYLEYDTPRAGTFEPLRQLPPSKSVVLGVITSKFPDLEDEDALIKRVREAAEVVAMAPGAEGEGNGDKALRRVGVSPQCGFASHEEGNLLGWEDMKAKLGLVRRVAGRIWGGEP